jgi:glycosidase
MKICITLLVVCCSYIFSFSQISKFEPPNWWADMHTSEIQIVFYGQNISGQQIETDSPLVIKSVLKTDNPNYIFATVETGNAAAATYKFRFKKEGKVVQEINYPILDREANSRWRRSFDASDVMYLIMPDRFANGDSKNDEHASTTEKPDRKNAGGRHGGDIQGIIKNLDYLQDLGVTAIWNTPLCEDNDGRYSYHGYAQSDVYKIDPRYGSNEDYKKLSAEMKKRGMKLIKDYVTNHWGLHHYMIKDLPMYDFINQHPGFSQSNYRMTTQFDPNASEIDSRKCMDGWFVRSMPDLNQRNPIMLQYLIQNAIWWIEYADLGGYRVDTYSYNDKHAIAKWTKAITDEYPHFNIVGEVWMHDQAQMAYWQKDSKIGAIQSYNSNLPSVMDFTLHDAIVDVFNEDKPSWDKGMIKVYENFTNDFLYPDPMKLLVFAENHDTRRINEVYKNDFVKYSLAMTLIMTTRGIPQIYYGTEIGMEGDKSKGDGDIRRDFPGGWAADSINAFDVKGRTAEQEKFHSFSKKLMNWRKQSKAIHEGKLLHFLPDNNVYVYFRYTESETVMVVINNNPEAQTINTERFDEGIKQFTKGKDILSELSFDLKKPIQVNGKSALVMELK